MRIGKWKIPDASSWRPCHRSSTQHVQVNVEHRLSRVCIAIEHGPVAALGVAAIGRDSRGAADHRTDHSIVSRAQVIQGGHVRAGNDEHVHRRLWIDVVEGDQRVVFVHLRGW